MKKHLSPEDYKTAASNGIHKKLAYERFYKYGWSAEIYKKGEMTSVEEQFFGGAV